MKRITPSRGLAKPKASPTPQALFNEPTPVEPLVPIVNNPPTPTVEAIPSPTPSVSTGLSSFLTQSVKISEEGPYHLVVEARAGTGKTTTLVEGLKLMLGGTTSLTPSPQQDAVWKAICLSQGVKSVAFAAFNSSIADELTRRVPAGVQAMTMHKMGNRAVTSVFGRQEPNKHLVKDLIARILGIDSLELQRTKPTLISATNELVGHVKKNLVQTWDRPEDEVSLYLEQLASYYGIEMEGYEEEIFKLVPQLIEVMKSPKGFITFDDMIWLPVALNLPLTRYDMLLVDEAQDLNRCQQELAKRAGRRLILCGDPKQAIYGFAGADCDSMPRMLRELKDTPRGCEHLPLTVTRRCGKAIVKEANKIVPDFQAFETNPEGVVREAKFTERFKNPSGNYWTGGMAAMNETEQVPIKDTYASEVGDGDFILCRVNAPLVSQCFKFIAMGKKANIQGRDIGTGLISTIDNMKAKSIEHLIERLDKWCSAEVGKENARKNPSEDRIIAIQDKRDCLLCFTEGSETVAEVKAKITNVFTDDDGLSEGIRLSSVHKAKGLEARRVFILVPKGASMPHPMAKGEWQMEQEMNLKYVAITRAIEELIWVY